MRERMDELTALPRVQIFATDIDESALAVARAARYPDALLDTVSAERRKRFFTADGGSYVVNKDVRDLCVFSPHSVIRDPPFSRLDLVSCRNLMIYFGPDVQSQVIPTFHYALRPGGYLFLGTSENVTQFSDLFIPLDKKHRIFRGREGHSTLRLPLAVSGLRPAPFNSPDRSGSGKDLSGLALRQTVDSHILERFAPAHVVVSRDGDVVYYSLRTGKYLEATMGAPSRQILTMARKGLRLDLRAVLREAVETDRRVTRENLTVENDEGRVQVVSLTVEPLSDRGNGEPLYMVVFADQGPLLSRQEAIGRTSLPPDAAAMHLERELRDTRERLQSVIEEYETALEELKSSNEELVSVNEELQSTNEELEASKEELQSLNEELHTVNAELNGKVEALDQANSDLNNLFESTKVATVFLDRNMVIRSYTPAVSQIFNIRPGDRGRPLTDLASLIRFPTLREDVYAVFNNGETLERRVEHNDDAHFLVRIAPYRDSYNVIEGVVLTFVDVTSLTRAEAHQRVLIAELNHRVKNMLTVVVSIAEQTYRTTPDPHDFKKAFVERVQSMARSYELLSSQNWTEASIAELIHPQLAPFGLERISLDGPEIRLKPKQALSLGMIFHELATNATKYGALGAADGRIELRWRETEGPEGDDIVLTWSECGGPAIDAPDTTGFGLKLVDREMSYNLQGSAEIGFSAQGLTVTLRFPRNGPFPEELGERDDE